MKEEETEEAAHSHFHRQIWAGYSSVFLYSPAPALQQGHMCYSDKKLNEVLLKSFQRTDKWMRPNIYCNMTGFFCPHQFLQAFFFPASPQLAALRDAGSGFFKSSSSNRASESMRSWETSQKKRKTVNTRTCHHEESASSNQWCATYKYERITTDEASHY